MKKILFLHGWGGDSQSFALLEKFFAKSYQVFCPSMPLANGKSIPNAEIWTLDDYAVFIEDFLRAKNVKKCHIIAHSFGARVAVLLINRNPELAEKLIIVGGAGLKPHFNLWVWLRIKFYKIKKRLFRKASGGSADYKNLTDKERITFQNIINRDLSEEIKAIQNPTLLIYGKRDRLTPPYMGKRFSGLCPAAELKIYKNCGHFTYLDAPVKFIEDAEKFFDEKITV